jgi:hypothetical protein
MHGRAIRRHHLARMKSKANHVFSNIWGTGVGDLEWSARHAVLHANHMAVCSCSACGNPRRHFHMRTQQERLAILSSRDQAEEVLECQDRTRKGAAIALGDFAYHEDVGKRW